MYHKVIKKISKSISQWVTNYFSGKREGWITLFVRNSKFICCSKKTLLRSNTLLYFFRNILSACGEDFFGLFVRVKLDEVI